MSIFLDDLSPSTRRATRGLSLISSAAAEERKAEERRTVDELRALIGQQARRIDELRKEIAVQVEHKSGLRRAALLETKANAEAQIAELTPALQNIREEWNVARDQNRDFQVQWGSMRSRLQKVLSENDTVAEKIEAMTRENESLRGRIGAQRDHLSRITRDKGTIKEKTKRALECMVVDDSFLRNRLSEEERYTAQLSHALQAMQSEYQEFQNQNRLEFAPKEDIQLLRDYLHEMQERTRDLQRHYLDVARRAGRLEERLIADVHKEFGPMEQSKCRFRLRETVLSMLEARERELLARAERDGITLRPRPRKGEDDRVWYAAHADVWEAIVREMQSERRKIQREEANSALAAVSQQVQAAKGHLEKLRLETEGAGDEKRLLLHQIRDLRHVHERLKGSEELHIRSVQDAATLLDEDLASILHYVTKQGFNDYVSSTDGEDDVDEGSAFPPLDEETTEDVAAIISSYELDPDDPNSVDVIQRNLHRPPGPLREFAERKNEFLQKATLVTQKQTNKKPSSMLKETLERAAQDVQERISASDIKQIRDRALRIRQGRLNPREETIDHQDESLLIFARGIGERVGRWMQGQKERGAKLLQLGAPTSPGPRGASPTAGRGARPPIVIHGARVPREVQRGSPHQRAAYFLNQAVRGVRIVCFPRRTLEPQLRHVFMSRDLTRLIARRVGFSDEDDLVMRVVDVEAITLGHKSDVFRDVKAVSKAYMSEELAFSILSDKRTSFDLEADTADERTLWASVFAFVVNESRSSGSITALLRAGKIAVVDTMNRTPDTMEINERINLEVMVNE